MTSSSYQALFELASGGMGTVNLEVRRHGDFERLYAVKRLRGHAAGDADIQHMFLEEARLAGLLRHPNIVSVLDVSSDEQGPLLVMEWIDGVTLHHFVRTAAAEGPIPVGLACAIASQVARGLHAAHELTTHGGQSMSLVHRDVSPSNILVGFDGLVRVTDFGIAKALGGDSTTGQGILKGKFGYMSPEQLRFDAVDRRSDLFALGVVLFEMLSAERLYGGKKSVEETARAILHEPPPGLGDYRRDVPPELEELLFELLAKTPEARPPEAREVSERLEAIARDVDESVPLEEYVHERFGEVRADMQRRIAEGLERVRLDARAVPIATTNRRRVWGASVVVAVVLSIVAWFALPGGESPPEVSRSEPQIEATAAAVRPVESVEARETPEAEARAEARREPAPVEVEPAAPMRARRRVRSRMDGPSVVRPGEGGWNAPE